MLPLEYWGSLLDSLDDDPSLWIEFGRLSVECLGAILALVWELIASQLSTSAKWMDTIDN